MQLTFGQVEELLARLHHVVPSRRTMLRSRLQHLQKEDLPPGVAVGRGTRFAYGLDETFMIVVALELARARMPASHAAAVVKRNWPALRSLVDAGLAAAERGDDRPPARWAVVAADGLSLLRSPAPGEETAVEIVEEAPAAVVAGWLRRTVVAPEGPLVVVDVAGLAKRVAKIVTDPEFLEGLGRKGRRRIDG